MRPFAAGSVVGFGEGESDGVGVMVGADWLRVGEGIGVGVTVACCMPVHPVMSMMDDKIAMEAINCFIMLLDVWVYNLIIYRF
ncbi:hypothetical protein [Methanocella paludicola]|uniref:hypothetical protein n=1 Tax=Methanocella paludicola TaxID=570267 RepID=UPI000FFC526B|nr:hypothetical protein [Methanocella paludicola]